MSGFQRNRPTASHSKSMARSMNMADPLLPSAALNETALGRGIRGLSLVTRTGPLLEREQLLFPLLEEREVGPVGHDAVQCFLQHGPQLRRVLAHPDAVGSRVGEPGDRYLKIAIGLCCAVLGHRVVGQFGV